MKSKVKVIVKINFIFDFSIKFQNCGLRLRRLFKFKLATWTTVRGVLRMKKGVLRNFTKFTVKHLCHSLRPATLLNKRLWYRCFTLNFAKFLGTPFLQKISGQLLLNFSLRY